jgi:hypothetical protein
MGLTKTFIRSDSGFNFGKNYEVIGVSWGIVQVGYNPIGQGQTRTHSGQKEFTVTAKYTGELRFFEDAEATLRSFNLTITHSKQLNRGWVPFMVFTAKGVTVSNFRPNFDGLSSPTCEITFRALSITAN